MIKIDFEMTDGTHTYRDALHLADDHQLTDADIEQMKQARFNRWIEVINNPTITEPVVEEFVAADPVVEEPFIDAMPEQGA